MTEFKPAMTADEFRAWFVETLEFLAMMAAFIVLWPHLALWAYAIAGVVGGILTRFSFNLTRSRTE